MKGLFVRTSALSDRPISLTPMIDSLRRLVNQSKWGCEGPLYFADYFLPDALSPDMLQRHVEVMLAGFSACSIRIDRIEARWRTQQVDAMRVCQAMFLYGSRELVLQVPGARIDVVLDPQIYPSASSVGRSVCLQLGVSEGMLGRAAQDLSPEDDTIIISRETGVWKLLEPTS